MAVADESLEKALAKVVGDMLRYICRDKGWTGTCRISIINLIT
jgi:hypothetical protein